MQPLTTHTPVPLAIEFAGEAFHLFPDRAIHWPARGTLLIADVHFGKAAAFRALGVPVPDGGTAKDLCRITRLLRTTGAKRLIILGDLLHARSGCQPEVIDAITDWRAAHLPVEMLLVRGNHDHRAGRVPADWKMTEIDEALSESGFIFTHDAPCERDAPTFSGHVHPVTFLRDFDGSSVSLPCFVVEANCVILPAFGSFTGGYTVHAAPGRNLFLTTPSRVIPQPPTRYFNQQGKTSPT